jgi:transcriptional regulator with XRE-family HTH domain
MRPSRNPALIQAFSAVLRARRTELGLTQEDLAGTIDLDRPFITMMEAGRKQPTLSVLWRLAGGLQLTVAELSARIDETLALILNPAAPASPAKPATRRPAKKLD